MAGETTITIIGNLTRDPDLAFTDKGLAYARFTVASTPRRFDPNTGAWEDGDALFMRCTAWRQIAENTAESLSKGARVVVTGRLKLNTWTGEDGQSHSAIDLDVDEIGPSLRFATAKLAKATRTTGKPASNEPPF